MTLFIAWVVSYYPTVDTVIAEWSGNGPYSHGFLALGICLYLIWQRRSQVSHFAEAINWLGLLVALGFGFAWWLAMVANVLLVQQFSLLAVLNGVLLMAFGWRAYRSLVFPMLVLLLAWPIWGFIQGPFRDAATLVSYQTIKLLGVPIFLDGYMVSVAGGQFFIERACAGLSYFLAAVSVGVLFTYFNDVRGIRRYFFVLLAAGVSIACNWIRIIIIILVGNYAGMSHPLVVDHLTFGWVVFAVALVPLFWVGNRYFSVGTPVADDNGIGKAYLELVRGNNRIAVVGLGVVLLFPLINYIVATQGFDETYDLEPTTLQSGPLVYVDAGVSVVWEPQYEGYSSIHRASYRYLDQIPVSVLVINYQKQQQGKELIYVRNKLFSENNWHELSDNAVSLGEGDDEVRIATFSAGLGKKRYVAYWYIVGGKRTADKRLAKIYEVLGVIRGATGASVIAVALDGDGFDEGRSMLRLKQVAKDVMKIIHST